MIVSVRWSSESEVTKVGYESEVGCERVECESRV